MNKEIKYINIEEIYPHPDNPRKDVGDVSELADSIKSSGILQNLTVIPGHRMSVEEYINAKAAEGISRADALVEWKDSKDTATSDDGYTVIIGHRRLAAAKIAGLRELPCIICEMPYAEQISTMLCENMQRRDLTIIEEIDGIQLMLDLGETVESISDKTGLSKSTIYKRRNMAALNREKLRESLERGPKLEDYAELEKIKDEKEKDKVLEKIGTPDFKWYINAAIQQEERERAKDKGIKYLSEFAEEIKSPTSDMVYEKCSGFKDIKEKTADRNTDTETKRYFRVTGYGFDIYRDKRPDEVAADNEKAEKEQKQQERKQRLRELSENAYKLRFDFIKNFAAPAAKGRTIDECIFLFLCEEEVNTEQFSEIVGILPDEDGEIDYKSIVDGTFNFPLKRALAAALYSSLGDYKNNDCTDRWDDYEENESLERIYAILGKLGYEMSNEERKMLDGTHELYEEV